MSIRVKKKRRLTYLGAAVVVVAVVSAAAYGLRTRQIRSRLAEGRAEGVEALAAGNYELALHKIGRYVQRNDEDVEALYQYAQAREQVPEPDGKHIVQAIAVYRQLLALQPARTDARRRLLNLYVDYGFDKEALDTAEALWIPDDPAVLQARAKAHARLRKFDEALKASLAHNEKVPTDLETQRLTLEIMLASGEPATGVVDRARGLKSKYPSDPRFDLLKVVAHRMAGDAGEAKKAVLAAASSTETEPAFVEVLVEQLEALELFDESLRVLTRSTGGARNDSTPDNERLLAARLWQAKRYQELADRRQGLDPADLKSDSELLALCAMALIELNRRDDATPIIKALGERFDASAEAWGPVLKTIFATPAPAPKDTIRVSTEALNRVPQSPYFHQFLADAYAAVGEHEHAVEHWGKAAQLAPAWAAPRVKVAALLIAAGRPVDALPIAQAAHTRAAQDAEVLSTLADAYIGGIPTPPRGTANAQVAEQAMRFLPTLPETNDAKPVLATLLHAAEGGLEEAVKTANADLEPSKTFADTTYLRLAAVSEAYKLGVEEACLARSQQAHGVTTALAARRARVLLAAGKADEGKAVLESAKGTARDADALKTWRTTYANYLDAAKDPAAKQAWVSLADELPGDAAVQLQAIRSPSVQSDRDFLNRAIDNLKVATSEHAIHWRVARARWLVDNSAAGDNEPLARAAGMLGDVTRDVPNLPEPRLLLARCLLKLNNPREAIEQFTRVVNADPDNHTASLELASVLQQQGDFAGAQPHLDRVADSASASATDRAAAATLLMRAGDTRRALALMEQLRVASGPNKGESAPNFLLAELYRQNGQVQEAKQVCQKILERAPDPATIGLLADILAAEGNAAEAEKTLTRLDESKAPSPQKELIRGRHYAAHGEPAKALEQFSAATKAAPGNAAAWRLLARQHLLAGGFKEAVAVAADAEKAKVKDEGLQALQKVAAAIPVDHPQTKGLIPLAAAVVDAPRDERAVTEVIKTLTSAGNASATASLATQLRKIAHDHPGALAVQNLAARASAADGTRPAREEAVVIATRAMQTFPNAPEPAEIAASALSSLGRWNEALGVARQWKQRAPSSAAPDLAIAQAHLALRQPDQALAQAQRHVSQNAAAAETPVSTQASMLSAQAMIALGRTADAEKLLSERLAASPQYRLAWINIAGRQLPDQATAARWLEAVEKQMAQAPFNERAALAEGWVVLSKRSSVPQHAERAKQLASSLLASVQASPQPAAGELTAAAMVCEAVGDLAAAESAYNKAIAAAPNNPVAMNNLAMILVNRGKADAEAAEKLAMRAAAINHPNRSSFFDTLATIQAKLAKWEEAEKSIEKAIEFEPTDVGYQIHQALILRDGGDERAREAVESVLAIGPNDPRHSDTDRERLKSLRQAVSTR